MRRHLLYSAAAFLLLATLIACGKREAMQLRGDIAGLPDGAVYLVKWDGAAEKIDSTHSAGGRFAMPVPKITPDMLFVGFDRVPELFIPLLVEGDSLNISGDIKYPEQIAVSGGRGNEAFGDYRSSLRKYDVMLRAVNRDLEVYADSASLLDSLRYGELVSKRDSIRTLIWEYSRDFVGSHSDNIVSAMIVSMAVNDSASLSRMRADSMILLLDTAAMSDNVFLRRLRERLNNDR